MISNFIVAVKAVLPMFILIFIGMGIKKGNLLTETEVRRVNHMVFVTCFPAMMFTNLYGVSLGDAVDLKLIGFALAAIGVIYGVALLFTGKLELTPKTRGAMIHTIYRSNFVIMGMPVTMNIFGQGNMAVPAMMVSVIVPVYNVLAVITMEVFRGGKVHPANMVKRVITNPLILGALAGMACTLTGLQLPEVLVTVVDDLSGAATPMALMLLGASIDLASLKHHDRNLMICVIGRLIAVPAVCLTVAAILGFRGIAFVTLIAMFASPTAISAFTMAQSMDSDSHLTGNCVVVSSAFACFTMFLWIFIFKTLGMF